MNNFFIIFTFFSFINSGFAENLNKETIYKGTLNEASMQTKLVVSNFYEVNLNKEKSPLFEYQLKKNLTKESFNAGIYKATEFNLIPLISQKKALSLTLKFMRTGEFKMDGETIYFEGELNVDEIKIGNLKYQFNLYELPIRRVYNPKVSRSLENTKEGFIIVETREH